MAQRNGSYFEDSDHLALFERLDPSSLNITDEQKIRFARAIRILNLKPQFQLSDLQPMIRAKTDDPALWEICYRQIAGYPKPTNRSRVFKTAMLEKYMRAKNKGESHMHASPALC
jgi:hypothetical protein